MRGFTALPVVPSVIPTNGSIRVGTVDKFREHGAPAVVVLALPEAT